MVGPRSVGIDLRPRGPRDLADIDIASRVDSKSVRREKFAELDPRRRLTKTANQLPLMIDDTDARTEIGDVSVRASVSSIIKGS